MWTACICAGMDIASEVAQSGAARTVLSCRRQVHVVPRYIFGKPSDARLKPWYALMTSLSFLPARLPKALECHVQRCAGQLQIAHVCHGIFCLE